ncbi:hypothetical protein AB0C12_37160 [Actinoplanes sp. NPDC048967]|uniref:hypothetical protein n=1 Tax=Actinoplanes sp. NPDC048967 TaxID=3155269 RepID=UPI003408429E
MKAPSVYDRERTSFVSRPWALTTRRDAPRPVARNLLWPVVATLAAAVFALRFTGLGTAYDAFIDEPFYTQMGASVAAGHLPPLNFGTPFLLHPPGFFLLESLWREVVPVDGDLYHDMILMRLMQQPFAVATALLLFGLVLRLAGFVPAVVAAALFALDAFILRQNGRVLIETATVAFVMAGYLLLIRLAEGRTRRRTLVAVGVGSLFAAAVLTKDMALLITGAPMAVIAVRSSVVRRSEALIAALIPVAAYLTYALSLVAGGYGGAFWSAKTSGFARLLGAHVVTGFNAPGTPSLAGVLWSQASFYGGSYLLVGLGTLAGLLLLVRPANPAQRILGLCTTAAALMTGYNGLFGTFEEHFLYFLELPALAALAVVGAHLWRHEITLPPRLTAAAKPVVATALVVLFGLNAVSWERTRATPDNAHQLAVQWLKDHAPAGTKVAWTDELTEYGLQGSGLVAVRLDKPDRMAREPATYLVTCEKIIDQGYSFASRSRVDWFTHRSTKVFSHVGRSYGEVAVYRTADPDSW